MRSNGDPRAYLLAHTVEVPGACWRWTGTRDPAGYGRFRCGQRGRHWAHRLSYETHVGPIPAGLYVLHRCDNPPCTNPTHLFLGTYGDNVRDASAKGRIRNQNSGRTVCRYGHELTPENTYQQTKRGGQPNGRGCRACQLRLAELYRTRHRDQINARKRERRAVQRAERQRGAA